jgi:hypothetical protein
VAEVAERNGVLEVSGVDRRDLEAALSLLPVVQDLQADDAEHTRERLLRALMHRQIPLTPPASVAQAQRLAAHRDSLLASEVLTHETLQRLRGDRQVSSTRTWVARKRTARELFTVVHDGQTIVPAFQFAEDGMLRPELRPLLEALAGGGVEGWQLWTWLTSPSSLLSGGVPHEVARKQPERALRAAQRFAAPNAA